MKPGSVQPARALPQPSFAARSRSDATTAFAEVLTRAIRSVDERASAAGSPANLDAAAALRLQASVYREAERVELVSKLVDHAVGSIKTLLQTRV